METRPHRFDRLRDSNPKAWDYWMYHVCKDEDGTEYGWGRVLDYIGVKWEDVPEVNEQMTFDFDKVFHKSEKIVSKDCPCRKCEEPRLSMNNPYYQSERCECCNKYKEWRSDNG